MLKILLDELILKLAYKQNKQATVIIMHPNTWIKLVTEIAGSYSVELVGNYSVMVNVDTKQLSYNNIPVFRSDDVKEGVFHAY